MPLNNPYWLCDNCGHKFGNVPGHVNCPRCGNAAAHPIDNNLKVIGPRVVVGKAHRNQPVMEYIPDGFVGVRPGVNPLPIKPEEDLVIVDLNRSSLGLALSVKAHPAIEDFMRRLGNGTTTNVELIGKYWVSFADNNPVEIYDLGGPVVQSKLFRLDAPGEQLIDPEGSVNLSFLRIKGTSGPDGVSFGIRGVYSDTRLAEIWNLITKASDVLYTDYIKMTKLSVVVTARQG